MISILDEKPYPSGNIIVIFWHQEDICVSITLHISEFVCCLYWEYVITAKIKCNESYIIPYKRLFFKCANTVIISKDALAAQKITPLPQKLTQKDIVKWKYKYLLSSAL